MFCLSDGCGGVKKVILSVFLHTVVYCLTTPICRKQYQIGLLDFSPLSQGVPYWHGKWGSEFQGRSNSLWSVSFVYILTGWGVLLMEKSQHDSAVKCCSVKMEMLNSLLVCEMTRFAFSCCYISFHPRLFCISALWWMSYVSFAALAWNRQNRAPTVLGSSSTELNEFCTCSMWGVAGIWKSPFWQ